MTSKQAKEIASLLICKQVGDTFAIIGPHLDWLLTVSEAIHSGDMIVPDDLKPFNELVDMAAKMSIRNAELFKELHPKLHPKAAASEAPAAAPATASCTEQDAMELIMKTAPAS